MLRRLQCERWERSTAFARFLTVNANDGNVPGHSHDRSQRLGEDGEPFSGGEWPSNGLRSLLLPYIEMAIV
jgi:hypothetical protein